MQSDQYVNSVSLHSAPKLFVTGGTGFIGARLLERLVSAGAPAVTVLVRSPDRLPEPVRMSPAVKVVVGDITDPASYQAALAGVDTVLHLAAATGAASSESLEITNVQATATLLAACRANGVRRVIYLSSIAATYPDTSDYPYGDGKRRAEILVRESGVPFVIVRPTIVLGEQAANWPMLRKLASLPVVPLIGGGTARVQPVDVMDVVTTLCCIVESVDTANTAIDVGGPEVLTFAEFLQRIRSAAGMQGFPALRLPAWPLRLLLRMLSAVTGSRLPVSPGQLVPFTSDGVALASQGSPLLPKPGPLDDLLRRLCAAPVTAVPGSSSLRRECESFSLYLSGRVPDEAVMGRYVAGDAAVHGPGLARHPIDRTLVDFAAGGPLRARIADAYSCHFRPHGLLRRKLVLLLAILENSPGIHSLYTRGGTGGAAGGLARIVTAIVAHVALLAAGMLLFGPRHLLGGRRGRP